MCVSWFPPQAYVFYDFKNIILRPDWQRRKGCVAQKRFWELTTLRTEKGNKTKPRSPQEAQGPSESGPHHPSQVSPYAPPRCLCPSHTGQLSISPALTPGHFARAGLSTGSSLSLAPSALTSSFYAALVPSSFPPSSQQDQTKSTQDSRISTVKDLLISKWQPLLTMVMPKRVGLTRNTGARSAYFFPRKSRRGLPSRRSIAKSQGLERSACRLAVDSPGTPLPAPLQEAQPRRNRLPPKPSPRGLQTQHTSSGIQPSPRQGEPVSMPPMRSVSPLYPRHDSVTILPNT